jgi:hypothetical protein
MNACKSIVGIPKTCGDNNQGSIQESLIIDFDKVEGVTITNTGDPDTDGVVTAVTLASGAFCEQFTFPKDVSQFTQELVQDLAADTHGYSQVLELGFRRIDIRKRNAISILAEGRRNLIAFVKDWNGDWWMLGKHQGLRLTASQMTTQMTRVAGQLAPITLTAEYEPEMLYKVNASVIPTLLPAPEEEEG